MQIIYETERLLLCSFSRDLIRETNSEYQNWFYDFEVTKYNSHGLFPYGKEKFESYLDMCESGEKDIVWGIIYKLPEKIDVVVPPFPPDLHKYKKKHIGNISLQRINWINRSAEFAIVIGEKEFWGQGIGYEVLQKLLYHGFERLNLHRIWTGTAENNTGMGQLARKLNMKQEGLFYDAVFLNGKYINVVPFSILEEEWKEQQNK